jgi:hypothetical protein
MRAAVTDRGAQRELAAGGRASGLLAHSIPANMLTHPIVSSADVSLS